MGVCEYTPTTPNKLNELLEVRFLAISFYPDWQIDSGFFNKPIIGMAQTQFLVQEAQNKDFRTACRWTSPEFSFICGTGYLILSPLKNIYLLTIILFIAILTA